MLFNSVFTIFWDFNIQCRVCYTACSVNRRETVSLFKFPIKSLMIPFELNWPVSLITIYILYVIITHIRHVIKFLTDSIFSFMGQWGVPKVKGNHRLGAALTTRRDRTTGWLHWLLSDKLWSIGRRHGLMLGFDSLSGLWGSQWSLLFLQLSNLLL